MVVGGEDFRTHLAAAVHAQLQRAVEIYNEYGPTEAVVGCMIHRYDPAIRHGHERADRPAGRSCAAVRPERGADAGAGRRAGRAVHLPLRARARLPRTAELTDGPVSSAHPFREGDRLYRTGDLARFSARTRSTYLGRIDRQLKVSGMRVEPGEIEAALLAHDAIEACVVTGHRQQLAARRLGARRPHCLRCGIPSNFPACRLRRQTASARVCRSFESIEPHAQAYFGTHGRPARDLPAIRRHAGDGTTACSS